MCSCRHANKLDDSRPWQAQGTLAGCSCTSRLSMTSSKLYLQGCGGLLNGQSGNDACRAGDFPSLVQLLLQELCEQTAGRCQRVAVSSPGLL